MSASRTPVQALQALIIDYVKILKGCSTEKATAALVEPMDKDISSTVSAFFSLKKPVTYSKSGINRARAFFKTLSSWTHLSNEDVNKNLFLLIISTEDIIDTKLGLGKSKILRKILIEHLMKVLELSILDYQNILVELTKFDMKAEFGNEITSQIEDDKLNIVHEIYLKDYINLMQAAKLIAINGKLNVRLTKEEAVELSPPPASLVK